MEWKEVTPNIWKPTKAGEIIEGVLISKDNKGSFDSTAYSLENSTGQMLVWGSAVLDDRMKFVNPGELVRIEFLGTQKNSKGQDVKLFKVSKGTQ